MARSIIPPKRYESARDAGVEKGVRPLLTPGFKGGEILTGVLGGVVIEYPAAEDAQRALARANRTEALGGDVGPPQLFRRTLFIDYSHQGYVERIVRACGLHPDARPPVP
jgi:hypothetical protein